MKKVGLKIIGVLVVAIFLLQNTITFAAMSKEEEKLNGERDEIKNQQQDAEKDLKEVQAKKSKTMEQVEELSTKIEDYETQIDTLNTQISELNTKINDSQQKLDKAQEDYTKQEDLLNKRLVASYEAGETSYLDFLLSSESITDFISNYYLITEVATSDTELLEKIQKQKEEIEKAKKELEESKKQLSNSKASKQNVSNQLQTAKKEKDKQVEQLSEDEKEIQKHIEELRNASSKIEKEIQAAQARYAAQLEELRKQKEQENANKNNNSSNGGSSGGNVNTGSGVLQRPVNTGRITATMYYSNGSYHGALDYGIPVGTPIYAAADGVVYATANLTTSYGTYVVIQHTNGLQTWYAHGTPGSIAVSPGQIVSRGQQIMKSGNSGNSSGPHLHFEVRVAPYNYSNCRVDPRNYF